MAGGDFVHLHVHSQYSLLDGAGRVEQLVEAAADRGMKALSITDHGVMYGVIDFYKAAKARGIKPIIGAEVYLARRTRHDRQPQVDDSPYHLVLLAENQTGYKNLMELVTRSFLEGFYYKPRVDMELLKQYSSGLIALSGCVAGEIPELILEGRYEQAKEAARRYRRIFGPNNFFLELQDHGLNEQKRVNPLLVQLARELNIPLVATNDVHYVRRQDARIHDVLLCIQTGKTLEDTDRLRFSTEEFYLKSAGEMYQIFEKYPEALANTLAIAERCQVELEFGQLHLPDYQVPPGYDLDSYLKELCYRGLKERFGEPPQEAKERLDYELKIIRQMGYSGYFLIVWDLVNFARQKRIPVGPGRGSAAGSLVAYVLGITNINPLQYDLLFERFLNPERVTMPDIDIDFCFERRGEIIEYVSRKYGSDRVAQIITFGTMAAKAAIRDVGRVMNFSYQEADRIAKLVPNELGVTIDRALQLSPELKELYERDERIKQLLDTARALEGMPRHASTHAAGIVIAKEPLTCYLPLQKTSEGMVTTQFPMQTVEEIGLLKMDILGLRTLTVIGDTLRLVEKTRKISLDIDQIPLDDEKTYSLLSRGETIGVFQLESSGMRNILRNLKPERFEDIIALVALYRPGPLGSGMVDDFINRKHGKVPVEYLHPLLKPILEETYGVILYQEQVMRIASEMAGFTLGQADLLRRAMGKKKPEVLAAQRENFLQGAEKRGVDRKTAEKIFELMAHFAGYGFNKSHSAAYAYIAYQTAYLKANYPVEYMASLLTSIMENSDKVPVYIEECRRMGIEILPPDVNESLVDFTVVNNKIRFGLAAVKNVGKNAIQAIISARNSGGPFKTLTDFCQRVDLRQVNRRVIESLIRCGAFNSLGVRRSQLLAILERCLETAQQVQRDRNSGQMSLIDLVDGEETETSLETIPDIPEFSRREILAMEKEMLGFYVSGHPLAEYQEQLKRFATHSVADLESLSDETAVKIGGILTGVRKTVTRKGEVMAYLQLEDTTGRVEVLIFPRVYSRFSRILQEDTIVVVEGKVSKRDEELKVFGELVKTLPSSPNPPKIYIRLEQAEAVHIEKLKKVLMQYRGNSPVYLYFPRQNKCILINNRYWVDPHPKLEQEVEQILGKGNLKIVQPGG